jgi:hypothetical protein
MDVLEQFKKKFARVLLTQDDTELISRMQSLTVKVDKENKRVEIHTAFDKVESPRDLFALEDLIRQSYGLNVVRIFPKYPSHLFGTNCIPGLIALLKRMAGSGVSYGFFEDSDTTYAPVGGTMEIRLRRHVSPA